MSTKSEHAISLNRRRLLSVAAASLLVIGGCATFRRQDGLKTSINDLSSVLDSLGNDDKQVWLRSIARRIEIRARDLGAEHQAFVDSFDSLLASHSVTTTQLKQFINTHSARRRWLRDDLLHLQDELHDALDPDEWADVIKVLNRTGTTISDTTLTEI